MDTSFPTRWRLWSALAAAVPAALAVGCSSNSTTESSTSDAADDTASQADTGGGSDAQGGAADAGHPGSEAGNDGGDAGVGTEAGDAGSDGPGADASDGAPDSSVPCNTTLVNSAPVVISTVGSGLPPALAGGTIAAGTYYVTGYTVFPAVDAGSNGIGLGSWQETALISGNAIAEVQATSGSTDGGAGPDQRNTFTFSTSGSSLILSSVCGGPAGVTVSYEATAGDGGSATLEVLVASNTLLVLTKQ